MKRTPLKRKKPGCTCDLPEVGQFDHSPHCPRNHNRLAEEYTRKLRAAIDRECRKPRKPLPAHKKPMHGTNPDSGDTLTVDGQTYTFRQKAVAPTDIQIGATASKTAENINTVLRGFGCLTKFTVAKPRKPLPKQSAKRKARSAEYEAAVRTWKKSLPDGRCQFMVTYSSGETWPAPARKLSDKYDFAGCRVNDGAMRCPRKAGPRPHHMALRGLNLCNVATFMACCNPCHRWIHEHPNEARRLGYLTK